MKCGRNVQVDASRALLLSRLTAVLGLELRLLALQPVGAVECRASATGEVNGAWHSGWCRTGGCESLLGCNGKQTCDGERVG